MGDIEPDYLWLEQRKPRRKKPYRLVLLLCLTLGAGTFMLYLTTPGTDTVAAADHQNAPDNKLKTALRIEHGMLLTPTDNLVYSSGPDKTSGTNAEAVATSFVMADAVTTITPVKPDNWIRVEIQQGDTLSIAFARHNLSYEDSLAIAHLPEYGNYFVRRLRPGDTLKIKANDQGHVLKLEYPLGGAGTLVVEATADGYNATLHRPDTHIHLAHAAGVIRESFYAAATDAGLTPRQVMKLVHVYNWTIDLGGDLQTGDRFAVVYKAKYRNGHKVSNGTILAASFQTHGETYRALRFVGPDDEASYYQPDGSSMRPAFIRSPLDYKYISSPFNLNRHHPILDTVRPHEGTDYAAPMGTPVHAPSEGVVIFQGRRGGYGNMVIIDHGNGITTRYGHLSRFPSDQHVGSHVERGEVIGYVGSTGLSTGPHLHYEYRINGVPKNPETVDLPGAPPVPEQYMAEFLNKVTPLIAKLERASRVMVASNGVDHLPH